jgi:hypothetical protein
MRNAVIWLADEGHQGEVNRSRDSVRAVMPELEQISTVVQRHNVLWYADWIGGLIAALALPVDNFVFFDSDVYAVKPFEDIFTVLDHYDLMSTHAPARQTTDMPFEMPDAFCEFNTGVLAFCNKPLIRLLFEHWRDVLIQHADVSGDNDQSALRIALWDMPEVKVWVLPPEYNCRFGFGGFAAGEVKLLHGRSSAIKAIGDHINLNTQMRTWERGFYS